MNKEKVSTKSFAYKMANRWTVFPSDDFCIFWRQVVIGVVGSIVLEFLVGLLAIGLLLNTIIPYIVWFNLGWFDPFNVPGYEAGFILGHGLISLIIGFFIYLQIDKLRTAKRVQEQIEYHNYIKEHGHLPEPKKQNMFVVWYKSIRDKTCHKLEFVNDETN